MAIPIPNRDSLQRVVRRHQQGHDGALRRNSNKDNPPKLTKANVVGSGTAVIIISPLSEPSGLATPETAAKTTIADESMMEPPPPPAPCEPPLEPLPPPPPPL